jgi:ferredoxin
LTVLKTELEGSNHDELKTTPGLGTGTPESKGDRERCQGHARCIAVASGLFQLDALGNAHEIGDGTVPPDLEVKARLAAADCPELAIAIIETQGD